MSTKDFTANVISATKVVPDGNFKNSKASGIWDINEALDLIKGGNWPNVANVNPAAFVDALFQTHLYEGNGGTQTITNGIDLSGSGGLVWTKDRDTTVYHALTDTERGGQYTLYSSTNDAQVDRGTDFITSFNSNGYSIGADSLINDTYSYVSWTFRKQPKFFDVVKYEGTGSARTVAHSLNTTVGMIIIKNLDQSDNWAVYHRANTAAPQTDYLILNTTAATADSADWWNDTAPTTSVFTVGTDHSVNASGENYVAYLFAHNDDDGGFGEPGDQDIIKCGSYTGNGSGTGPVIDLGFEPQWVLIKASSHASNWFLYDAMRGIATGGNDATLYPDDAAVEANNFDVLELTATGFNITYSGNPINDNGATYIYMAIRRGGMQTPTAASSVFAIDTFGSTGDGVVPGWRSGFPVDMAIYRITSGNNDGIIAPRLTAPKYLRTNSITVESTDNDFTFDYNNGWYNYTVTDATYVSYMWARARGYFDVVSYKGTGSARTQSHSLGVVPEMMWVKKRNGNGHWTVYHSATGATKFLELTTAYAVGTNSARWNDTTPTSSVFSLGDHTNTNIGGDDYIAYLFATVANVSKVGSFTQSGATNVACGFTGDTPSLVMLKRTDDTGDWYLLRDIVAGNDKSFYFNTNALEITNADIVDPYSGGFATTSSLTDGDYVFYAIAAIS